MGSRAFSKGDDMAQLMLINPAKRPKKRKASPAQLRALAAGRKRRAAAANPAPRRRRNSTAMRVTRSSTRRRARRNPIGMTGVMGDLVGAVQGAGGALAVNAAMNILPLPASLKTGWGATASKIGLAVALGMLGRKVLGRSAGKMAEGAMTVAAYEAISGMVPTTFGGSAPAAGVAGLGYYGAAQNAGGNIPVVNGSLPFNGNGSGMGEYVSGLGEYVY